MTVPKKMLAGQAPADLAKYGTEVDARIEAAYRAAERFHARHPEAPEDVVKTVLSHALDGTLAGLNFVIEELRTATLLRQAEGLPAAPEPSSITVAEALTGGPDLDKRLAAERAAEEEYLRKERKAIYVDGRGDRREVQLGRDGLVEVKVTGLTFPIKDSLKDCGLRPVHSDDKRRRVVGWGGRIGREALMLLGNVVDERTVVTFIHEEPPRLATPAQVAARPGADFY